jgi:hypothetical protein
MTHADPRNPRALRELGALSAFSLLPSWSCGDPPSGHDPIAEQEIRSAVVDVAVGHIQSLADLANAHDVVREMRVLPLNRQMVVTLAIVVALPYLPLTLTMIPFKDLLSQVIGKVLGW